MAFPIGITSSITDIMVRNLFKFSMGRQWEEVDAIHRDNPAAYKARITKSGETALHIAVNDGKEYTVQVLVDIISKQFNEAKMEGLKVVNKRGNIPLHLAASMGNVNMCSTCIACQDPSLMGVHNNDNETPFYLAALHGKKYDFLHLHNICGHDEGRLYYRRKEDETIFHLTILENILVSQINSNTKFAFLRLHVEAGR